MAFQNSNELLSHVDSYLFFFADLARHLTLKCTYAYAGCIRQVRIQQKVHSFLFF